MNTFEIKNYLERHEDTRGLFLNVYAVDQLPKEKIRRTRWLLVVNCCPASRRGKHWVAMYCENDKLEFFDSFGMPPSMYEGVPIFIERQRPNSIIYNCQQLQSIDTDVCGHYCITYAVWRAQDSSLQDIMHGFIRLNEEDSIERVQSEGRRFIEQLNDRDSIVKFFITNSLI